ncbi:MAG TPA: 6-phosphogluconolactonase, partial [Rhabdochlamydiaceae bacterium]|nr:6-phosphogluconolactonase [Rhabdochlamydiaceae bacterium]
DSKISSLRSWDERRTIAIPGDHDATVHFCLQHLLALYQQATKDHGSFYLVLSGGSTPKELYEILCRSPYKEQIDWRKVYLFWGDERSVPPSDPKSNYHMAMEAGFKKMPIPAHQIVRMHAEEKIEENALAYEKKIQEILKGQPFDLIILGCGDDGHTASLFPHTKALKAKNRLVVANQVPQLQTWRMTLTYECINQARNTLIYVLGASKKEMVAKVLQSPDQFELYPIQAIGTKEHQALWILDQDAAETLLK